VIGERGGAGAIFARGRLAAILVLLGIGFAFLIRQDLEGINYSTRIRRFQAGQVEAVYGRLPLNFEPNRGQSDARVQFQARGNGYGLYLTREAAFLEFGGVSSSAVMEMRFAHANRSSIQGEEQLPGHSNYFIGNDPSQWRSNIPQFARVKYSNLYHGIDLTFYGNQGRLEYDFTIQPGADPNQIGLDLIGAQEPKLAADGDLVLTAGGRELRFEAPRAYQQNHGLQRTVASAFTVRGNSVGFEVGDYDRSRSLIIDPVLTYSTFLGGTGSESCAAAAGVSFVAHCPAIAVDSASRAYIAGTTTSSSIAGSTPAHIGPGGGTDVFVARINSNGTALDYVTYIGGSGTDYPTGVAVDGGFNAYIGGTTASSDFPTTATAFQTAASSAPNHAFLTKLNSSGSANDYTTYLSGSGAAPGDQAAGLAVDTLGRAYLFGTTTSSDFPVTGGALQTTAAATDQFFFSKIDPSTGGSNSLQYSTFIGGSTPSNGTVSGGAIAVDGSFNVYLAGATTFTDMPVVNAYQSTEKGGSDAWVARLNAPANNTQLYTPLYETYLGGSGNDVAYGIANDTSGSAYVTGSTTSGDFTLPTATTAFQSSNKGSGDGFIARFGLPTTTGTTQGSVPLNYFTYLGGSAADAGLAIVVDSTQNARVAGFTDSGDFPTVNNPVQGISGGGRDAFFARISTTSNSTTTNPSSSTFLGGSAGDTGTGVAIDPALNNYVSGETASGNFPTANALQPNIAGGVDAFVSKLGASTSGLTMPAQAPSNSASPPGANAANPVVSPSPVGVGSDVTFKYYIFNTGDPVSGVVFNDSIAPGSGTIKSASASVSGSSPTCSTPSGGTVICNLGTVGTSTTTTATPPTLNVAGSVTVTVTAPTTVLSGPLSMGNSAFLSFPGGGTPTISGSATVNDFKISASPASATVKAGEPATFTVKVTPTGSGFPESVSLACGSGLPSNSSCSFPSNGNPIPNMSSGPQSRALEISTQARVTTTGSLFRIRQILFSLWLPVSGLALIGSGISRRRRWLLALLLVALLSGTLLQLGCGYSNRTTTTTTGTPAGTYTITVNATSGSTATRTTTVQLTVE